MTTLRSSSDISFMGESSLLKYSSIFIVFSYTHSATNWPIKKMQRSLEPVQDPSTYCDFAEFGWIYLVIAFARIQDDIRHNP